MGKFVVSSLSGEGLFNQLSVFYLANGALAFSPINLNILPFHKVKSYKQKKNDINEWLIYEQGRLKLLTALFIASQSTAGRYTLEFCRRRNTRIALDNSLADRTYGKHLGNDKLILINPRQSIEEMVATLWHESYHREQYVRQGCIKSSTTRPEDFIYLGHMNESSARTFEVHCAYEVAIQRPGWACFPKIWEALSHEGNYYTIQSVYLRHLEQGKTVLEAMAAAQESYFYGWNENIYDFYENRSLAHYKNPTTLEKLINPEQELKEISWSFIAHTLRIKGIPYLPSQELYAKNIHRRVTLFSYLFIGDIYNRRNESEKIPENLALVSVPDIPPSLKENQQPLIEVKQIKGIPISCEEIYETLYGDGKAILTKRNHEEMTKAEMNNALGIVISKTGLAKNIALDFIELRRGGFKTVSNAIEYASMKNNIPIILTAMTLIELGLRAPQNEFPQPVQEYMNQTSLGKRCALALKNLKPYWGRVDVSKISYTLR